MRTSSQLFPENKSVTVELEPHFSSSVKAESMEDL